MKITRHRKSDGFASANRNSWLDVKHQTGKVGYILLWLLGVPIPVFFVIYLLRGCT